MEGNWYRLEESPPLCIVSEHCYLRISSATQALLSKMPIYFYTARDEYGCFSNFSPYGVEIDGRYWPTVEHYFQAQKFTHLAHQERIARARTPKEAKRLGWDRTVPMRDD